MTSPVIGTPWKKLNAPVSEEALEGVDKYWRVANYLSIGQIYLRSNPLMKEPFTREDVKHRLVGHWGTTPGLNFLIGHINRFIADHGQNTVIIMGPGHGGPAGTSQSYLDGTYTETFPKITKDEAGLQKFFRQFSYPGGIPSHFAPETPGSIHEGGELGYALSHAYGAIMDNPSLFVPAIVGDGEAETGPLATGWQSNKLVNPRTDGIVLPILHLNGYKIANPTILSRISDEELHEFFHGMGYEPYEFVAGFDDEDHMSIHRRFAELWETIWDEICDIKATAQTDNVHRPFYPMLIFRTPKGWTCPKYIDGKKTEGSWRSHQVPLASARDTEAHFEVLKNWLESYKPEELFDANGAVKDDVLAFMPKGELRIGANPNANGGVIRNDLKLPNLEDYEVKEVAEYGHGWGQLEATRTLGAYTRDIIKNNPRDFRIFGPDETASNRLQASYEVTNKQWDAGYISDEVDEHMHVSGQVVEQLSEHQMEGFLEAYLLTGRHGFFASYESFIRVVDSMVAQHAKWLKVCSQLPWRQSIASLNLILTSNVWQQDHNGFTHQDPGFLDHIANKKADVVRLYLPPDTNCLLSCFDHCVRSRDYVNVLVTSKHPRPQWLTMEQAVKHCTQGVGIWDWASSDAGEEPDVVMACCGDTPTLETLAAVTILRDAMPELKIRVVNVVDLMKLEPSTKHPHGLSDADYDALFTKDKPIIFAFHGYPTLIHELTYERTNRNLSVHGYQEEGTITTPFDMRVQNEIDRFHLVKDALQHLPQLGNKGAYLIQQMNDKLVAHKNYIHEVGQDLPEIIDWKWHLPENK